MRFPDSVDGLLAALDEKFPEVIPTPGDDQQKVMYDAGQRSVVAFLKQWRKSVHSEPAPPKRRGQGRTV